MKKSDFFYELPEELIAQSPASPRDSSRLLVYDRKTGAIADRLFTDITEYLQAGDLLVINNTKVIPARLYGEKKGTGARIEFLLHKRLSLTDWEVLARPAKRLAAGDIVVFSEKLAGEILSSGGDGAKTVRFSFEGVLEDLISKIGEMPLPHYIKNKLDDNSKYQTVYARFDGSSAAPTAGLHFTQSLMDNIKNKGIGFAEVLLHVGLGTFRPVKSDDVEAHRMHSEYYSVSNEAALAINAAKREGRRVIAIGTTSVRVLESAAENGHIKADSGNTDIFIYPPYKFKIPDAILTNFHLPESTLIMLISAFCGREQTMRIYEHAVKNKYRFFSFGDAMLIL